jgi:pimeloyl-ACP methyl ester carboxylesterase
MLRSFAGGRLMGEVWGTGTPTVLALHGWSRSRRDFSAVLAPPGKDPLEAVALDLPGFGSTPAPPEAWGSPEYADLVAEILPDMAGPVVVLGHSFGGRVALQLAAARPNDVAALVLTGVPLIRPAGRAPRPPLPFRAARLFHRAGLLPEARMEAVRRRYGSTDYRAAEGVMRRVLVRLVNERYDDVLKAVQCPVTLVWGADDSVTPLDLARVAADRLSHPRVVVLPGVGHLTPLSAPLALHEAVSEALVQRQGT